MITLELTREELAVLQPILEDYMKYTHWKIMAADYFSSAEVKELYRKAATELLAKVVSKAEETF